MNLPNKLTIARIIMTLPLIFLLLFTRFPYHLFFAFILFILASITDLLDGKIARKYHLITDFGKFLDPVADKILVISTLICFISLKLSSPVAVIFILSREFMVTSLRMIAANKGTVIPAGIFGKIKTVLQMSSIVFILLLCSIHEFFSFPDSTIIYFISNLLIWIATLFTILSGCEYLIKNRSFLSQK